MKNTRRVDLKKGLITFVSVIFMGISLSVLKLIDCGLDTFTYMNTAISSAIGWSLGNWQLLLNVLMFIPVIIWGRKQIGVGTLFNMVLVGYTVDFCMWFWNKSGAERLMGNKAVYITSMIVGLIVFIFSAATYMSTNLGTAPFDALPMIISDRLSKIPFKVVRFLWDVLAAVIGFVLCGEIGIVTIIMILFLGQTVELVRKLVFKESK